MRTAKDKMPFLRIENYFQISYFNSISNEKPIWNSKHKYKINLYPAYGFIDIIIAY